MGAEGIDRGWRELSEEILTGMKEWRLAHPRATFGEIEAALDEGLGRLRARMLQDAALASSAAEWAGVEAEVRPVCPECGTALVPRGKEKRGLQTQGGQEVVLERSYGVCPACGAGLFPPG
jgi:YgiT-type zinc finger domain-containing protein